ncbi:acyltransferase family protein [Bacillus sp. 1P06AnD]|uniref:acyltransferase family protein n=1 Tax=Bacillus sp. 1P06AnD TaxID=3132208 RepID=UPI0039A2BC3B
MSKRSYFFDNAKFILIFLVVLGHLLRTFIHDDDSIYALYKTIYTFHMPAFVLISGFFAKGIYRKGYVFQLFKKLIIPYFIFQGAYSIYYYYLDKEPTIRLDPFEPHWSLWFLISLFFWNLLLLGFAKLKPVYGIPLSISLGLLIGYIDVASDYLSITRTFVFFPMFLIGFYLTKNDIQKLFLLRIRFIAILIFAMVIAGFYIFPDIDYQWLLGSKPYSEMDATFNMLTRFFFYLLSFIMIASFLSLVPRGRYFFTLLGERTLYVYLLHGFFIQFFRESKIHEYVSSFNIYWSLIVVALMITLILSSRLVFSLAQPLIEVKTSRFKPQAHKLLGVLKGNNPG